MSNIPERIRDEFGWFWEKGAKADGLELNGTAVISIKRLALEAAAEIERLQTIINRAFDLYIDDETDTARKMWDVLGEGVSDTEQLPELTYAEQLAEDISASD